MAGRKVYPADVERAAPRVEGVRPGGVVAVRLDAGRSRVRRGAGTRNDPENAVGQAAARARASAGELATARSETGSRLRFDVGIVCGGYP